MSVSEPAKHPNKVFKGIERRSMKDGTDRFRIRIRKKGFKEFSGTYRTATLALKNKHRLENALEEGEVNSVLRRKHRFQDLVQRYAELILPKNPKNARNKLCHLTWWNKKFGHLFLEDVKSIIISEARDELLVATTKHGKQLSPTIVPQVFEYSVARFFRGSEGVGMA